MKKTTRLITILIFIFMYIPMAVLIVASFNTGKDITQFEGFTLQQYVRLFQDDKLLGLLGKPVGVSAWEPFDADGEDQLYNYLGMGGVAVEPTPYFDETAPVVLLTENSACDPTAMDNLEAYVRRGGTAVVTAGFFRRCYEGMKQMTSARLTHRHALGDEYMVSHYNYPGSSICRGHDKVLFEIMNYKTNATWADISVVAGEYNFPLLTEDRYGRGRLFILNVPENFADLYKLPAAVWQAFARYISLGQRLYIAGDGKHMLITYDNGTFAIQSCNPMADTVNVIVRSECAGIRNLETGAEYTQRIALTPPGPTADSVTFFPDPQEYCFPVTIGGGCLAFFGFIGEDSGEALADSYIRTNPYE